VISGVAIPQGVVKEMQLAVAQAIQCVVIGDVSSEQKLFMAT
jgi:hypothetical protein